MSAWGRIDRASRVMKGADDPLTPFPNVKRWFTAIDGVPVVTRARAVGKDHEFKKVNDEEARVRPSVELPATDG
jgi:GST-like protein